MIPVALLLLLLLDDDGEDGCDDDDDDDFDLHTALFSFILYLRTLSGK